MKRLEIEGINSDDLKEIVSGLIKSELDKLSKNFTPKQPNEYLTRSDVAKLFSVDISTVSAWSKSGKLKPLGLAGRVYFLRSDIEQSLIPLNQ